MSVLLKRNKQSLNQVVEILNSFPKQNQKLLYITKIAPLKAK